jgi:hypothetical protein
MNGSPSTFRPNPESAGTASLRKPSINGLLIPKRFSARGWCMDPAGPDVIRSHGANRSTDGVVGSEKSLGPTSGKSCARQVRADMANSARRIIFAFIGHLSCLRAATVRFLVNYPSDPFPAQYGGYPTVTSPVKSRSEVLPYPPIRPHASEPRPRFALRQELNR